MKKKLNIIAISLCLVALPFMWYARANSKVVWVKEVLAYLENEYEGQFELLDIKKKSNRYVFFFRTNDNNSIPFEVKGWIGGAYTPWGTLPYIPERHFVSNFPKQITQKFVDDSIIIDMTDQTMEEVVFMLKSMAEEVQSYYNLYDIKWEQPKIDVNIKHNGKTERVVYPNEESTIRYLVRELFY